MQPAYVRWKCIHVQDMYYNAAIIVMSNCPCRCIYSVVRSHKPRLNPQMKVSGDTSPCRGL